MTNRHIVDMVSRDYAPKVTDMQSLKTISMRIRGYDEETEELTDTYANLSGEIADLTKTSKTPGGISIFEDDAKTTYKSTYKVLQEISHIYDDLSDKQRANLLEKLFGKTRAQTGAAILTNFEAAEKAMTEMGNSAGNADKEMEIIQESLTYKLNALKETWVGFAQSGVSRESFGGALDVLTTLSEGVTALIENLGVLKTAFAAAFGVFTTAKGFGKNRYYSLQCPFLPDYVIMPHNFAESVS